MLSEEKNEIEGWIQSVESNDGVSLTYAIISQFRKFGLGTTIEYANQ